MGIFNLFNKKDSKFTSSLEDIILSKKEEISQKDKTIETLSNELEEARKNIENIEVIGKDLKDSQSKLSELIQSVERMQREEAINDIEKSEIQEKYNSLLKKYDSLKELNSKKHNDTRDQTTGLKNKKYDTSIYENLIKKPIKLYSKYVSIEAVSLISNEKCRCPFICNNKDYCYTKNDLFNPTKEKRFTHTSLLLNIENISNKDIKIDNKDFMLTYLDGFIHKTYSLCSRYALLNNCYSDSQVIPANSKIKYELLSEVFGSPDTAPVLELIYKNNSGCDYHEDEDNLRIKFNESGNATEEEESYKRQFLKLHEELDKLKKEKESLQLSSEDAGGYKLSIKRRDEELMIKYEIIDEEAYIRIVSLEEEDTISVNREFNKSKANYNWVNKGEALISVKADNTFGYGLDGRTSIESPSDGIYECDNNKNIKYKGEICRIRKYSQSEKESVILELEKQDIKDTLYKKERKKMIERETLDELLSEGKVFNVYTKKDGNRTTIPMDVANAVWNRDGGKCCICGKNQNLEFDHIIPLSKGGATTFRNLQLLCKSCNAIKSDNI